MTDTTYRGTDRFRIGRVFGNIFSVIGRNLGVFLVLGLIFSGIPTVLYYLLALGGEGAALGVPGAAPALAGIFGLVSLMLALILQAAVARATIEDLNGQKPALGDAIRTAGSVFLPVLGITILVSLGIGLGFILLIVPGIILILMWAVAVPVQVQERAGVLGSLGRSRFLTKGSRWRLFGLLVILAIILIVIQALGSALFFASLDAGTGTGMALVVTLVQALLSTVTSVITSVASAASYVELRFVKEGTTVEELAEIFA